MSEERQYTTPWVVLFGVLCAVVTWGMAFVLVYSVVENVKTFPVQWVYTVIIWLLTALFPLSLLMRRRFVRLGIRMQKALTAAVVVLAITAVILMVVVGATIHREM